jgi:hypothetical protein
MGLFFTPFMRDQAAGRKRGGRMVTLRNPSLSEMASSGQNLAHMPQPKQELSSRSAIPSSFSAMASVGHLSMHVPHPEQASPSIMDRW